MNNDDARSEQSVRPIADSYYRHLCEEAGIAMISTDRDLAISTWNAAAARMFGASASEMIGVPLGSVIPTAGRKRLIELSRHTVEGGEINNYEFQHRDADGAPRMLIVTVSPVLDDDGNCIGTFSCFRDITHRIDLQNRSAERNKMASLGRMAGALAHHLNNILGGAVTSIDFSISTDVPSLHLRTLEQTGQALARATRVIDSLLAFAEGDRRRHELCDLSEVINEVTAYMAPEMKSQNVELRLEIDEIPATPVPRASYVTIIENILHNAVDSMPDGGMVTVAVRADDDRLLLSVSDGGCGMDVEARRRAFEPFFSTKSRDYDFDHHPGLGLAVVHGLTQVMGHSVDVDSTPGEGTTVTIGIQRLQ